ncbi:YitT family protein [Anaerobacillus alkaliphilus]|uniref:YitT family protein n=1 Tax=Anaerobacillus alkaliphilus TaxID=1548597 RepID=A0A4Q0VS39_9BACI|nr:YitT family protein [Anaerobacillus alkaliphilus]RXI99945.1 YitT family protein [Anaerobacillus alkaliphilus]
MGTNKRILGRRWLIFIVGLLIMSLGIVLMIEANLGVAPWDVLHIGLTKQVGLTVGSWSIIVGFCIISITSLLTKELPKLGAFINMVLVGVFIDIFRLFIETPATTVGQYVMLLVGVIVCGYGIGLYIAPKCGAGPRDSLMIAITELSGWKVQHVRLVMEIIVLIIGWQLGGPVFIGTVIFSLTIGNVVGYTLPQCQTLVDRMIERGIQIENIDKGTLRVNNHDGVSKEAR